MGNVDESFNSLLIKHWYWSSRLENTHVLFSSMVFILQQLMFYVLTHWSLETHMCHWTGNKIDSCNGLAPSQAIYWTNVQAHFVGWKINTSHDELLKIIFPWMHILGWCVHGNGFANLTQIDTSQNSHNASDKYPTMHHFVTEMCTFLLQNDALWDVGLMHCGICVTSLMNEECCSHLHCITKPYLIIVALKQQAQFPVTKDVRV